MIRTRLRLFWTSLLAAIVCGCVNRSIPAPSNTTPVILISIDTLRSDHLPAYGYKGVETPAIDALRGDSILYERAYSQVPLTLPSHASLLTGMLPADNGVRDNIGNRLSPAFPTIATLLKKNGYRTGAAVSAFVLRHENGLDQGFDFYDDQTTGFGSGLVLGRIRRSGDDTLKAVRPWLDAQGSQPFFLFFHLYDPHTPYEPPEPFFSRYANHYDGAIAYSDKIVGELLSQLKARRLYDDALIILLSDHGEGLNDHGEEEHGMFLYREALQVPLLVKLPKNRRGGTSVSTPVELLDVFPTILERTATAMLKDGKRSGESLLTFVDGGPTRPIYAETMYPRFHFGWSDLHSLIEGNQHFIRAPQDELYDMASDPGEKKNRIEADRRTYVRMRAAIEPMVREATLPAGYDPEEVAKLAALGYVGSTVQTKPGQELPDPKTKLATFHDIRLAYTLYKDNNLGQALQLIDRLLAANEQIVDLWDLRSNTLYRMGRREEALESAKQGLRQNPGAIALLFNVANIALSLGDLDTAQQHAELAVGIEPGQAHEVLARIWIARNNSERAEQEAKLALKTVPDPTTVDMILAAVEMDRSNYTRALQYLDDATAHVKQRSTPKLLNLHRTRGEALARLGRPDEAEREFRAEIADFPADPLPYSSLIILLATQRKLDAATQVVFDAIKAAPVPHTYVVIAETMKAIGDDKSALFWTNQGLQHFPGDPELRALPKRLASVTPALRARG